MLMMPTVRDDRGRRRHHRYSRQPAGVAGGARAHRRARDRADLLRRRSGRLWAAPDEVCALIAEREIPTIYGNYDYAIARDLEDCGCAYITRHDREVGQQS